MVLKKHQNPKGGLNQAGRDHFKRTEGANLKKPISSGTDPRRISFAARMSNLPGPMVDSKGRPTRKALSLKAWGFDSIAEAKAFVAKHKKKPATAKA
tara:strand:- start:265 stop:555 length:291 start_codon:yes stop_codon:yes gene_type:complete